MAQSALITLPPPAAAGGAANLLATGTITAAQVALLHATPIELIAAPAAGKFIEFLRVHLWLDFNSAAYTTNLTNLFFLRLVGELTSASETLSGVLFAASVADAHIVLHNKLMPAANAGLEATILIAGWSGGDSDLKWEVEYRISDLEF